MRNNGFVTSGSLTALDTTVDAIDLQEYGTGGIVISGTWTGTIYFQASLDGVNFTSTPALPMGGGALRAYTTSNGTFAVNFTGLNTFRLLMFAYTSGTADVSVYGVQNVMFSRGVSALGGATDGTLIGNVSDAIKVETDPAASYSNLTGNGTTTVKSGAGRLRGVLIGNDNTSGDVVIYDNTAGSGTKIASLTLGSPSGGLLSSTGQRGPLYLPMNVNFTTGLTVVTSGSSSNNITVIYR